MFAVTCTVRNNLPYVRSPCIARPAPNRATSVHEETLPRSFAENPCDLGPVALSRCAPRFWLPSPRPPPFLPSTLTPARSSPGSRGSIGRRMLSLLFPLHDPEDAERRLRQGELIIERLTPSGAGLSGGLLHHWRGTAFVPGAQAADFERLMRNFDSWPQHFSPQVVQAKVVKAGVVQGTPTERRDRMQVIIRVRQRHVITVVLDTTYDVTFGRLDARHGYSVSQSTRIAEVDSPGTVAERTLEPRRRAWLPLAAEHLLELRGAGWRPLSADRGSLAHALCPTRFRMGHRSLRGEIPRESLEFTLRSARNALHVEYTQALQEHQNRKGHNNEYPRSHNEKRRQLCAGAPCQSIADRRHREARAAVDGQPRTALAHFRSAHCARPDRADRSGGRLRVVAVQPKRSAAGDSLPCDQLVRRQHGRDTGPRALPDAPRYGFYVDHIVDIFGSVALMGGLACSGFVHWQTAIAMLVAFLLLSGERYLATYTLSRFQLSQGIFGPTEIRILLIVGNLALLHSPWSTVFGHRILLFDLGGAIAAVCMFATAIHVSRASHGSAVS